jgi:hypothetical protein
MESIKLKVIVFNECRYPNPPKRITTEVSADISISQLRQEIAEITKYKSDVFDFGPPLKNVVNEDSTFLRELVDDKVIEDPSNRKILVRITKRKGTTAADFKTEDEDIINNNNKRTIN